MLRWLLRSSFAVVLLAGLYCGADRLSQPRETYRTYHPNGAVQLECPLDSSGRWHGELREYHPSGRLRSVSDVWHGQMGGGQSYEDYEPDVPAVSHAE